MLCPLVQTRLKNGNEGSKNTRKNTTHENVNQTFKTSPGIHRNHCTNIEPAAPPEIDAFKAGNGH